MEYCSRLKHDTADTDLLKMALSKYCSTLKFFSKNWVSSLLSTHYRSLLDKSPEPLDSPAQKSMGTPKFYLDDLISWNSGFCFDVMCDDVIMDNKLLEDYNLDQKVIKYKIDYYMSICCKVWLTK